ncbi:hypothetical protein C9374_006722 [Naegleria lovaniensis]|uniref:Uncharacterized protein n=1 Tax=Naegleria lovaniensis TaxID=51637 RepID=A0AA88GMR6_NAELO|nr:uncharacterized protein C9374_006722 [Naegleria lovaniensis]KAG2379605.1 hypothetical protein C9374_006722 [Naegleria lovaniensis]
MKQDASEEITIEFNPLDRSTQGRDSLPVSPSSEQDTTPMITRKRESIDDESNTSVRFDPAVMNHHSSSGRVDWMNRLKIWLATLNEPTTRPKWYSFISPQGKDYLQAIAKAKQEQRALEAASPSSTPTPNLVAALYKFDVQNNSVAENYILSPFWNYLTANVFPEWLAPNTITLTGFICMALAFALALLNFYSFIANPETNTYTFLYNLGLVVISILIFLYNTFDGCDGKQARRTGSSSPLGEVFDHGVDALTMSILCLSFLIALGETPYKSSALLSETTTFFSDVGRVTLHLIMMFAFYGAHWEHYHTGRFYMGFVSASDGQFAVIGVHLASCIYNMIQTGSNVVGFGQQTILGMSLAFWIILITTVGTLASPAFAVFHVLKHYRQRSKNMESDLSNSYNNSQEEAFPNEPNMDLESGASAISTQQFKKYSMLKMSQELANAVLDLLVVFIFFALYFSMTLISRIIPSDVAGAKSFYQTNWISIYVVGALTFGIYLTTMNIARVTNQPYPRFTKQYVIMLLPMIMFVVNGLTMIFSSTGPLIPAKGLLIFNLVWASCFYLFFAVSVVWEFCKGLNIYAFRLSSPTLANSFTSNFQRNGSASHSASQESDDEEDDLEAQTNKRTSPRATQRVEQF